MAQAAEEPKPVAQNRRARFDYFIEETVEAGIVLHGTEVKSLRTGKASINESYAGEIAGELFLINANIPEYEQASKRLQHEIKRPRKLLVKRRELARLVASIKREGVTLVPMSVYFTERGKAKVLIGVAKGKKQHDKRATIKDRDWKREQSRTLRSNNKG